MHPETKCSNMETNLGLVFSVRLYSLHRVALHKFGVCSKFPLLRSPSPLSNGMPIMYFVRAFISVVAIIAFSLSLYPLVVGFVRFIVSLTISMASRYSVGMGLLAAHKSCASRIFLCREPKKGNYSQSHRGHMRDAMQVIS